jgi:hypothetical protein
MRLDSCENLLTKTPALRQHQTRSGRNRPLVLTPLELNDRVGPVASPAAGPPPRYFGVLARTAAHGNFRKDPERRQLADSVEKVDLERSPAILRRLSFDNALNLLMRKISRSRIPGAGRRTLSFSTESADLRRRRRTASGPSAETALPYATAVDYCTGSASGICG